ncbi:hypothetical protein Afil01_43140 [Actinorhabdospora filicis]|uniref:Major facilitator superfamily (MFS) profile domain-containing protein n=1 Tax=Actinorhabdospora filicis TaxID=1785913 RepID=A0A9W6W4P8_9ACTN|nr:MFS transporter [Actinorhabdospora filicis]GLZ79507.1 hypothetical protein Afil01_43140 [Actinorhabdospora filicis]
MHDLTVLRRRYVAISALAWLGTSLLIPVMVLLMTDRGLDLATIGLTFVVHGIVVTTLELPTGGLADVIGRRGVLAVSAALGAGAAVWMIFAGSAWEFIAITVIRGVARALSTGPSEAWYVDAVHAVDKNGDIRSGLAAGQTAGSWMLGIGTVAGGAIPLLPIAGALAAPVVLSALGYLVLMAAVMVYMKEDRTQAATPRFGELFRSLPSTIAAGVRLGLRNSTLARVMAGMAAVGIALDSVELLVPGRVAELTGDTATAATGYGVITMIGFAASGIGSAISTKVTRWTGGSPGRAAMTGVAVTGLGLALLAATGSIGGPAGYVTIGGGYALLFIGLGIAGPVRAEIMHNQVGPEQRATVVSVQSLAMQAGGFLSALGFPYLVAATSRPVAWGVAAAVIAASALLFRRLDAAASQPLEPAVAR